MGHCYLLSALAIVLMEAAPAEMQLDGRTAVTFATAERARTILTTRDEFVERLSPFDRSARLKTERAVAEDEYLRFVASSVSPWSDDDKSALTSVLSDLSPQLKAMSLPWPKEVVLIKTTGVEEGDAPYTRANAIVFPRSQLSPARRRELAQSVRHELFHILSRHHPELRADLYRAIGFEQCKEIDFPSRYAARRITNPDAPRNDHCIKVQVAGDTVWAMPILFARGQYSVARGGDFFDYMVCPMLIVATGDTATPGQLVYDKDKPRFCALRSVSGFFEQVGKNTSYVIHPEEILADNFAFLLAGDNRVPSPEILAKMKTVLKKHLRHVGD